MTIKYNLSRGLKYLLSPRPQLQLTSPTFQTFHRSSSSSSSSSVNQWTSSILTRPPKLIKDFLDIERSQQVHRSLPYRSKVENEGGAHDVHSPLPLPGMGDELPKGFTLIYCQPRVELHELSEDGGAKEYNAPYPYLRRMWASGSFTFNNSNPLILGDDIIEKTSVAKIEEKAGMMFVHQKKELFRVLGEDDLEGLSEPSVVEIRTHVFRPALIAEKKKGGGEDKKMLKKAENGKSKTLWTPPTNPDSSFTILPTTSLLFRFSALTFNAHRIHYDKQWAIEKEGHSDIVVHGPMTALVLLELANKVFQEKGVKLKYFEYRATSPMYVDREIRYNLKWRSEDEVDVWAVQGGKVGMKGSAVAEIIAN